MSFFGTEIEFNPIGFVEDKLDDIGGILDDVKGGISRGIKGVEDNLSAIYQEALTQFDSVITSVEGLGDNMRDFVKDTYDDISSEITGAYDTLTDDMGNLISDVTELPNTIRDIAQNKLTETKDALTDVGTGIQTAVIDALEPISTQVTDTLSILTDPDKFGSLLIKSIEAAW